MIPDYQTLMRPVLECSKDGEISTKFAVEKLAKHFQLSEDELHELLPSGKQQKFANLVNWAKSYLKQAGLIKSTKRGYFSITDDGKKALGTQEQINNSFLYKYSAFQDFITRSKDSAQEPSQAEPLAAVESTPDEILRRAHQSIQDALALELLSTIKASSPAFF